MRFKHELLDSVELERVEVDGNRHYNVNGKLYRSVTTALGKLNADAIQKWRKRVGAEEAQRISTQASTRGTAVHAICENYLGNVQDYMVRPNGKKFLPHQSEMFNHIKPYLDEHVSCVHGIETRMYSDELMLAGTCDCICVLHGVLTIVDFKTASKPKEEKYIQNYFLQAAAYSIMAKERYDIDVKGIGILIATEHDGLQRFLKDVRPYQAQLRQYIEDGTI